MSDEIDAETAGLIERSLAFRERVHARVCANTLSCTCPNEVTPGVLQETRVLAELTHRKFDHRGQVEACEEPHDVICKAVVL